MEETVSDLFVLPKPSVAHKHRPRTTKTCLNTTCIITVYCADCGQHISQYIQTYDFIECPIGATDSTEIS
jgi:hypothetical protein